LCEFCQGEGCFHGSDDHSCDCDVRGNGRCSACGCECAPWWSGLDFPDGVRDLLGDSYGDTNFFPASKAKLVESASSDAQWLERALPEGSYRDTSEIASALISHISPIAWKREPSQLIWKSGSESLASGQKLSVGQDQMLVMVASSGKICDKLGTGEYTISKTTLPLLNGESRRAIPDFEHFVFDGYPVFLAPSMEFEVSLTVPGQTKTLRRIMAIGIARLRLSSPDLFLQRLISSNKNIDTQTALSFMQNYCIDLLKKEMLLHEYDELKNNGELLAQKLSESLSRDLSVQVLKINFDSVREMGPAAFMPSASQMGDPKSMDEMRKWAESMRQTQMAQIEALKQMQQQRMQALQSTTPQNQIARGNICSACGSANPSTNKFCGSCGKPLSLKRKCPKCWQEVAPDVKFCGNCGANLSF
jgi:membrane protease subunit (stomatin/prohibitin family)